MTDTYKSVDWPAVATVGGMISFGFALEKTGAAGALAHAIVTNFQWAGANLILGALLMFTVALTQIIENAAAAIYSRASRLPNRARMPHGPEAVHGRLGYLHFDLVLHARCPRDHDAGDGSRAISF